MGEIAVYRQVAFIKIRYFEARYFLATGGQVKDCQVKKTDGLVVVFNKAEGSLGFF